MSSHDTCNTATNADANEVSSPPLGRHEALSLFIRLQGNGYQPYMFEDDHGLYRVCHSKLPA